MSLKNQVSMIRVASESDRAHARTVLQAIYQLEKNWVTDEKTLLPQEELSNPAISWFVVFVGRRPVGVLRVLYKPPVELYRAYGFRHIGRKIDLEAFIRDHQVAEIGRFAVLPEYRKYIVVAGALMRAALKETVERGYAHYITDIFEGEQHSPYLFHTRVLGFQPVATHDIGELNCPLRRMTMILDIKAAYNRLRAREGWVFRFLTEGWSEELHATLRDGSEN